MGIRYLCIIYIYYMRTIFNTKIHPRFSLSSELERLLWLDAFCHLYLYFLLRFIIGHITNYIYSAMVVIFVNYYCGYLLLYTTEHSARVYIWNILVWQYCNITGLANNRKLIRHGIGRWIFNSRRDKKFIFAAAFFWGGSSPTLLKVKG